ncbi:MAG: hypothetical protein WBA31_08855 [Candidatus Dormiibacterota bacterium]
MRKVVASEFMSLDGGAGSDTAGTARSRLGADPLRYARSFSYAI